MFIKQSTCDQRLQNCKKSQPLANPSDTACFKCDSFVKGFCIII